MEDKEYYEALEHNIVKEATDNGVLFEEAASIAKEIRNEGLRDYAYCDMLRSKLAELQFKKKNA